MAIELEKILTISAREYCEIYEKNLKDYVARGIHCESNDEREKLSEKFALQVPLDAEVVVTYRFCTSPSGAGETHGYSNGSSYIMPKNYASGTALIPKEAIEKRCEIEKKRQRKLRMEEILRQHGSSVGEFSEYRRKGDDDYKHIWEYIKTVWDIDE